MTAFLSRAQGSKEPLPANRFELYQQAINASVKKLQGMHDAQLVRRMVQLVAIRNHMEKTRNFGMDHVQKALVDAPAGVNIKLWNEVAEGAFGLPLVKVCLSPLPTNIFQFLLHF